MKFYELPDTLTAEEDIFEKDIADFVSGKLNPIKFKAIRVAHGVYEQRQEDTYMIRIRCAAGGITPRQLKKVAELGEKYGNGEVHFTTRQEVQVHNVLIHEVMNVIRGLREVDLSSRGGGGNTIRNILTSPDSGTSKIEAFDVDPYAIALTTRLIFEPDSWNLPRKFKIAMSNDDNDTAFTQATCLGYVATIKDGQKGFKVFCAGGMGAKPMVGNLLMDFIPDTKVYHVARAIKTMFDKHGNRRSKFSSRIKFLWKKLQREEFVTLFHEYYDAIKDDESLNLEIVPLDNSAKETTLAVEDVTGEEFELWKKRYVFEQKQEGLVSIKVPLELGDLFRDDANKLADFLEHFGDNTMRCARAQNIRLRNIPAKYLGNAYNVLKSLKKTLINYAPFIGDMINCTGASTCKLGICLPRGLSDAIRDRLSDSNLDLDQLTDFKLNMSGCPNTCGMHHIAHLGFFGKIGRHKETRDIYPSYNVMIGAKVGAGTTQYAERKGEVAARYIPDFAHDFLEAYLLKKDEYSDYSEFIDDEGEDLVKNLCEKYSETPSYEEDNGFYKDFGAKKKLSLDELGSAECSAGLFDMIDVDKKAIVAAKKVLDEPKSDQEELYYKILFHASRMLLVTRGIDAQSDEIAFEMFGKHFLETEIVNPKYKDVVVLGKLKLKSEIIKQKELVLELGDEIQNVYKEMDDSLRFKTEKKDDTNTAVITDVLQKDFRGVACPMNFVKTKLILETIKGNDKLEVLLDDGAPVQNVPNSVKLEGHSILEQKQHPEGHWSVLIQKKG